MKKIILFLLVLLIAPEAMKSQTVDPPSGYTNNYRFRKYNEGAHASADSVNANLNEIDATLKYIDRRVDSLKTRFNASHTNTGTLKTDIVNPENISPSFFEQYFVRYVFGGEYVWKLRVDQSQFDNDTIKIKEGIYGKLSAAQSWSGVNSFTNEQTNFGNGSNATINYQIANDIGAILWKINGSTKLKWDENDGQYWQFLTHVDVTGDLSVTGYIKPADHLQGSAPNGSMFYDSSDGHFYYKNPSGTLLRLD